MFSFFKKKPLNHALPSTQVQELEEKLLSIEDEKERLNLKRVHYLKNRVEHQIESYAKLSSKNKSSHVRMKFISIIFSGLIPILATLPDHFFFFHGSEEIMRDFSKVLIAKIGAIVTIITSLQGVYKFHENWIKYQTIEEQLKKAKQAYLNEVNPYSANDPEINFKNFVENFEAIIANETVQWSGNLSQTAKPEHGIDYNSKALSVT